MNDIPEQQLVKAARSGDADAFETLVLRYEKRVYALALRMCGNPVDAQEAAQEALLSAWQSLPFFRGEASFSTWLYRLTSNASVDLLRREKRQRAVSLNDGELSLNIPDDRLSPHEEAERSELRDAIRSGLKTLPDDYRAVLVLRELHQLSYQEISAALDVDLGTVKSRINRGRKRLCEFLTETGNFLPAAPSKNAEKERR
ncbi:sigma-70 family RNA polymerase sigma factor [Oscillibacter sp.]|uniref:RNA polymerase sigma factor n=1 Tax=Oscillibacter sp. TaxID=1945593 RepID=UPI0028AA2805|nr:sigma-70 family RNA polymerase sigma factor [Oscillibacter sp.]